MAKRRPGLEKAVRAGVVLCLICGPALGPAAAGERRGAGVRVYLMSGAQITGELLAVGEDSLTVLEPSGTETSCGGAETGRIILDKKGKRTPWGFIGFAAGAASGYLVGANPRNWAHDEDVLVLRGIGTGILWGALGAVVGSIAASGGRRGRETIFLIAGQGDEQLRETWKRLKSYARIRD